MDFRLVTTPEWRSNEETVELRRPKARTRWYLVAVPSATIALSAPAIVARRNDGVSRFVEFMLVGGATIVAFPLAWLLRQSYGLNASEYAVGFLTFYGAYVVNDPHFSVTYLLFYKDVRRRAFGREFSLSFRLRYLFAGLFVPVLLAIWAGAALALRSAEALGWMIQLMFFLVGWHYVKQGFGVVSVLSARRGTPISPGERKVLLAHCFAGWAYAWASPAVAAGEFEEKGVVYRAIAHPRWLEVATAGVLAVSTFALATMLVVRWRCERKTLPLAPLAGLLVTVWSWTIYSSVNRLVQYVIPALHSIQYFYFVALMKGNEARAEEGPPLFARPASVRLATLGILALALGWLLFHGVPHLLDAALVPRPRRGVTLGVTTGTSPADALGVTPYFAAFFVIVNLHHYFMDYVIWRRENPDTRFLRDGH